MENQKNNTPSTLMIALAFAIIYVVWGSTYFFIQKALVGFPPFILGALRFLIAGLLMMIWCVSRGEKLFSLKYIKHAVVTGLLLLFLSNGIVIYVEQFLPSAMVAIMISATPLWFVLLDKQKWHENLTNRSTIIGLLIGFAGVILLFSERIATSFSSLNSNRDLIAMFLVIVGSVAWACGSLYSKYHFGESSASVNTTWQMMAAGTAFTLSMLTSGELNNFDLQSVPQASWLSILYLVIFGSIIGFSAYVWLLKVQPATKVSTHAYVNPVVAVLLGISFGKESITQIQIIGLLIILGSVLLISLNKYKKTTRPV